MKCEVPAVRQKWVGGCWREVLVIQGVHKLLDRTALRQSNNPMLINIGLVILAYLIGSVASAVIVCRALGLGDPREQGSGNPGATNVLRLHGKKPAALTLCGDVLKGLLPVLVLRLVQAPDLFIAAAGLAAFSGHLYPVFFGFRGGKGVATLIGALIGFHWLLGAAFIITWLVMALISRYSSLSAITAAILSPVYCWLVMPPPFYITSISLMSMILTWRHRGNIKNLLSGKENKITLRNSQEAQGRH